MRAKAVFLDLDATLLDYDATAWAGTVRAVCAELRSARSADGVDPDRLAVVYTRISSDYFSAGQTRTERVTDGRAVWRDVWRQALAECGCADETSAEYAVETYAAHRAAHYALFPDVLPTLAALRELGLALVLITNGPGSTQRHKADATGLTGLLDAVIVSGEVGVAKPDRQIFSLAAAAAGVSPAEAWHVGDSLTADVAGARNAGLAAAVWLNRAAAPYPRAATGPRPDYEIATLSDLQGLLGALPADGAVDQLADEVGVAVVPRVLLDHVHVDPAQ